MNYPTVRREITHIHPRQLQQPTAGPIQPISEQYAIVPLSLLQQAVPPQPTPAANKVAWALGGALGAIGFTLLMLALSRSQQQPIPAATPAPTPQQPQVIVVPQAPQQPASRCAILCFGN